MSTPLVWAHRGAPLGQGKLPPENSLTAFRRAVAIGADALEFDLHPTKDGHLVVYHDLLVNHPTAGRVALSDLSLAEVHEIDLDGEGETIPTLRQVIEEFGESVPLVPELKSPDLATARGLDPVATLLTELEATGIFDRVIVQCFNGATLERLSHLKPGLPLLALYRHDQEVDFESIPGNARYLGIPMLKVFFQGHSLVEPARQHGRHIIPWREMALSENPEVFDRLGGFGVKAIMVDDAGAALAHYGRCATGYSCPTPRLEEPLQARRGRRPA